MKKWVLRILLGVVGVLVVAIGVLALMGLRQDAGVSRASIEIKAPREQVWPWIEEPEKFKRWVGWVVEVQTVNPVKAAGHKDIVLMKEPGSAEPVRIETSWTEYAPPERFTADVEFPGFFKGSQSYRLIDLGQDRTRLELISRIRYTSALVRLLEPLATPSATRKIETDLATLKPLAEGDAERAGAVAGRTDSGHRWRFLQIRQPASVERLVLETFMPSPPGAFFPRPATTSISAVRRS